MHDIRFIREFPDAFDAALDKEGFQRARKKSLA